MVNKITFRSYHKDDFSSVKEILESEHMFADPWESKENLEGMIARDEQSIIIAENSETSEVVGCVFLIPYGPNVVILFRLAIARELRNQGIGSKLVDYATEISKKRGVKEVGLFVDVTKNDLQEFYKKRGFILFPEAGSYKYMYRELK